MIMRIFQVQVRPGKEKEFERFFHETAIPMMRETEGIVQVFPGAPRADSPREFSFVMVETSIIEMGAKLFNASTGSRLWSSFW